MKKKKYVIVLSVILVLVVFFVIASTYILLNRKSNNTNDKYYQEGLVQLEKFEYSNALVSFKKAINDNPEYTDSYIQAANILVKKGQYDEAIKIIENGMVFADKEDDLYSKLGEIYFLKKDYQTAQQKFEKSISINSNNQSSLLGLIEVLARQGNYAKVTEIAEDRDKIVDSYEVEVVKAFCVATDFEKAINFLDNAINLGDSEETESAKNIKIVFEEALSTSSGSSIVSPYMKISREIINEGKPVLALPLLDRVIEENNFYEGGYLYKGISKYLMGDYAESEELLKKSVTYNSKLSDGFMYLALSQMMLGKNDEARINFDLALSFGSDNKEILLKNYIVFLDRIGDYDEEIEKYNELIILTEGNNLEYKVKLSEVYCNVDNNVEGYSTLINSISSNDIQDKIVKSTYLVSQACLYLKQNDIENAKSSVSTAKSVYSGLPFLYYVEYKIATKENNSDIETIKNRLIDIDLEGKYTNLINNL